MLLISSTRRHTRCGRDWSSDVCSSDLKFSQAKNYGVNGTLESIDSPTLRENKTNEINRLNGIYKDLLEGPGVTIIDGHGKVTGTNSVEVNGKTYTADRIVIATGGWPFKPDIEGAEYGFTSNEAFYLDQLPKRVVVIGGGYIAVEFAGIYNGLGVKTELVYRGEQILRGFDQDVRDFVSEQVAEHGVNIHTNTDVTKIEKLA